MERSPFITRWIRSMLAIAVALTWLHLLGAGDLGGPPLSLDGVASWLDHRDTGVAVFALLRLLALGFGWYLLLITAIAGAARCLRLRRLTSLVERLTFPFVRGMLGGMALLGVVAAPPPTPTPPPSPDHATLHLLPNTSAPPAPGSPPEPASPPASAPEPASPPEPTISSNADVNTWVVQRGESFWSIAAEHLADVNGQPVSEREVGSYWRQLVERNRSQLLNPSDANLLFAGQMLELPPVVPG